MDALMALPRLLHAALGPPPGGGPGFPDALAAVLAPFIIAAEAGRLFGGFGFGRGPR